MIKGNRVPVLGESTLERASNEVSTDQPTHDFDSNCCQCCASTGNLCTRICVVMFLYHYQQQYKSLPALLLPMCVHWSRNTDAHGTVSKKIYHNRQYQDLYCIKFSLRNIAYIYAGTLLRGFCVLKIIFNR